MFDRFAGVLLGGAREGYRPPRAALGPKRVSSREGVIRLERETNNQFFGPNLGYVLELYENYREDPDSVDGQMREFFESWSPPRVGTPDANGQQVAPRSTWRRPSGPPSTSGT